MILSRFLFDKRATIGLALLMAFSLTVWPLVNRVIARLPGYQTGGTMPIPYVFDLTGQYDLAPLLTVGDEIPLLEGSFGEYTLSNNTYAMPGIPDGLGLYTTPDAYYVFMNHEIGANRSSKISSTVNGKINGARVSIFQFTKDWRIVGGKNLIERAIDGGITYTLDTNSGNYVDENGSILNNDTFNPGNFSRFCSGSLGATGFVDQSGNPAPIWFAPQESGSQSRGWAVYPDGSAIPLDGLGRFSKEQVLAASEYRAGNADQTILFGTEDSSNGEIYMYIGAQTIEDPNGFEDGQLYVLRVEDRAGNGFDYETMPEGQVLTGTWTTVPLTIALGSGLTLSNWVNTKGRSTNFRRPEDIHEDPNNPGTFYFVTTGRNDAIPGTDPAVFDNVYGKMYRFTLADDPRQPARFEMVLEGGPEQGVSYDNIAVDSNGWVLIQEDRATTEATAIMAAQMRYARIIAYDIAFDATTYLFEANQAVIDPSSALNFGGWETSGIIAVDYMSLPDRDSYLFNVQAHSISDADYVQGGQFILATPVQVKVFLPLVLKNLPSGTTTLP